MNSRPDTRSAFDSHKIPQTEREKGRGREVERGKIIHAHLVLYRNQIRARGPIRYPNVEIAVVARIGRTGECAFDSVTLRDCEGRGRVEHGLPVIKGC